MNTKSQEKVKKKKTELIILGRSNLLFVLVNEARDFVAATIIS